MAYFLDQQEIIPQKQKATKVAFLFLKKIIPILCLVFVACRENYPDYDDEPFVQFVSGITSTDSSDKKLAFTFELHDGDGNFGLSEKDTFAPFIDSFQQNFYATPYYIEQRETIQLPYNFSYRIPKLRENGSDKFIKAQVTINMSFSKNAFPYDSILLSYFVFDRKLNMSNTDTSDVIVW